MLHAMLNHTATLAPHNSVDRAKPVASVRLLTCDVDTNEVNRASTVVFKANTRCDTITRQIDSFLGKKKRLNLKPSKTRSMHCVGKLVMMLATGQKRIN